MLPWGQLVCHWQRWFSLTFSTRTTDYSKQCTHTSRLSVIGREQTKRTQYLAHVYVHVRLYTLTGTYLSFCYGVQLCCWNSRWPWSILLHTGWVNTEYNVLLCMCAIQVSLCNSGFQVIHVHLYMGIVVAEQGITSTQLEFVVTCSHVHVPQVTPMVTCCGIWSGI